MTAVRVESPELLASALIAISKISGCGCLCGLLEDRVSRSMGTVIFEMSDREPNFADSDFRIAYANGGLGIAEQLHPPLEISFDHIRSVESAKPFLLFRTSGTSGVTRWVVHSEATLRASLESRMLGLAPNSVSQPLDRDTQMLTEKIAFAPRACFVGLDTISGYTQLVHCLALGIPFVAMASIRPRQALRLARGIGAGTLVTVPSILRIMMTLLEGPNDWDWPNLGVIGLGGGGVHPDFLKDVENRLDVRVIQGYGSTELGGAVTNVRLSDPPEVRRNTVGRTLHQVDICLRDGTDIQSRPDVEGELWVKSPSRLAIGTIEHDGGVAPLPTIDDWYATRDIASLDRAGQLSILGRVDDRISRGEEKFFPQEVETVIESHPAIAHAMVTATSDRYNPPELIAYCQVWETAGRVEVSDLRRWCLDRLRAVRCPDRFLFALLPVTHTGKVIRAANSPAE
jgi:acyl-coenzyme A synthetase/AMP-(fatty) acid ligase